MINFNPNQQDSSISSQGASLPGVREGDSFEAALKAAQEFEGFFLARFFESMYEGLETDGLFGGGFGEKVARSFLLDEQGKSMAQSGGIGLADSMMKEFEMNQSQRLRGHNAYSRIS